MKNLWDLSERCMKSKLSRISWYNTKRHCIHCEAAVDAHSKTMFSVFIASERWRPRKKRRTRNTNEITVSRFSSLGGLGEGLGIASPAAARRKGRGFAYPALVFSSRAGYLQYKELSELMEGMIFTSCSRSLSTPVANA